MIFSRRTFLRFVLGGTATALLPVRMRAQHGGGAAAASPALTPFVDPLPIPPVLKPKKVGKKDAYTITMKPGTAQCHRDLPPTNILGYNGIYPGPTIHATRNRMVQITQINNLGPMVHEPGMEMHNPSVHLHGALVPPESDGHPADGIPANSSRVYTYPNKQRGTTLWYHDHTHGATGHNVWQGLAGLYLLNDTKETALRLPRGAYEIPLVIQDRTFDSAGQFVYNLDDMAKEMGMTGDVVLVNGKVNPYLEVAARKYRFRILNGSNSRRYTLSLDNGSPLIQIGTDGGLLQRPNPQASIGISPAERIDVIIDFTGVAIGTNIVLRNVGGEGRTANVMQFKVTKPSGKENAVIPQFLAKWEEIVDPADPLAPVPITRNFLLNRATINGALTWVINGFSYDSPGRPVPQPKLNEVEYWHFTNPTNHPHPMHIHLVQFQIVNVNGEPQDTSDYGWKDTVVVPPNGGEITVAARFSDYTGKYVFHCHNLEHEDYAMMSEFEVIP